VNLFLRHSALALGGYPPIYHPAEGRRLSSAGWLIAYQNRIPANGREHQAQACRTTWLRCRVDTAGDLFRRRKWASQFFALVGLGAAVVTRLTRSGSNSGNKTWLVRQLLLHCMSASQQKDGTPMQTIFRAGRINYSQPNPTRRWPQPRLTCTTSQSSATYVRWQRGTFTYVNAAALLVCSPTHSVETTSLRSCVNSIGCQYRDEWSSRLHVWHTSRLRQQHRRTYLPTFNSSLGMVDVISARLPTEHSLFHARVPLSATEVLLSQDRVCGTVYRLL